MRNQTVQTLAAQHSQAGSEDEAVVGYSQVRNNYSQIEKYNRQLLVRRAIGCKAAINSDIVKQREKPTDETLSISRNTSRRTIQCLAFHH
jgi:hypothetical protein